MMASSSGTTAAVRWLGRFCLERHRVGLEEIHQAAEALERLPTSTDEAKAELEYLLTPRH